MKRYLTAHFEESDAQSFAATARSQCAVARDVGFADALVPLRNPFR
jgi:hypothetical protein